MPRGTRRSGNGRRVCAGKGGPPTPWSRQRHVSAHLARQGKSASRPASVFLRPPHRPSHAPSTRSLISGTAQASRSSRAATVKCMRLFPFTLPSTDRSAMNALHQYLSGHRRPLPRVLSWTGRSSSRSRPSTPFSQSRAPSPAPSVTNAMESTSSSPAPTNGTAHTNGNGVLHDTLVEPSITFDTSIFRSYLLALLPPVLAASPIELESLFDDEFDERVSRFAGEGGGVIHVVKHKDESEGALLVSACLPSSPAHRS